MEGRSDHPGARAWPLVVILALAAALYAWGITRALPESWDQDEITPEDVLGSIDRGPAAAWPARYPPLHFYLLAGPVSLLREIALAAHPAWAEETVTSAHFLVIRSVSLLMGLATIGFVYLAAQEAFGRRAAWLAAAAASLLQPSIYYAKTGNLDMPYTFWFAVSLWSFLRILRRHRLFDYLVFAVTAVFSVCTKDQAYALYLLAPIPLLAALRLDRRRRGKHAGIGRWAILDGRILLAGLTAGMLFLLIHGVIPDATGFRNHVQTMTGPDTQVSRQFPATLSGHLQMLVHALHHFDYSMGTPLLAMALIGIALALAAPAERLLALAALSLAVSYYLGFIAVIGYHWDRYFLPVYVLLTLFSGRALAAALDSPRARRPLGALLATLVLLYTALRAVNLDLLLVHDSRRDVAEWIRRRGDTPRADLAVGLGDPSNRQMPLLEQRVPWRHAVATRGAYLRDLGAKYLVVNMTDTLYAGQAASARHLLRDLDAGRLDYRRIAVLRYRPPLVFPESRYRCWIDIHSNLCLANPALGIYRREPATALGRHLDGASGDPARLLAAAAAERADTRFGLAAELDAEAVCLAPSGAVPRFWLGVDAAAAGDLTRAEGALRDTLLLRPEWSEARFELARLLARMDRTGEARMAAEQALESPDASPIDWLATGALQAHAGRRSAAARAFLRVEAAAQSAGQRELQRGAAAGLRSIGAIHAAQTAGNGLPPGAAASPEGWVSLPPADPLEPRPALGSRRLQPAWLLEGFAAEEREGMETFRWIGACALAELEPPRAGATSIVLDYACGPFPTQLELRAGGKPILSEMCGDGQRRRLVAPIDASAWFTPIELRVKPVFVPQRDLGGPDSRTLGVRVFALGVAAPH